MTSHRGVDRGLLVVRLAVGLVFIMHGGQKLFEFGISGTTAFMAQTGLPLPGVSAVLITFTELLGGLAVLTGTATRVASALLTFAMMVAIASVHITKGFFAPAGFEYPLTLLLVNVGLIFSGAGAYSVDAAISGSEPNVPPGWQQAA